MGVSPRTVQFYREGLHKFADRVNYPTASRQQIERYLNTMPPNEHGLATRHPSFRAIKTLYRWLSAEYGLKNPMEGMAPAILSKPIMSSLSQEEEHMPGISWAGQLTLTTVAQSRTITGSDGDANEGV
jgi:site-specific recombinase XerD